MDLQVSNPALAYATDKSTYKPVGMGTKQDTQLLHLLMVLLCWMKLYILYKME